MNDPFWDADVARCEPRWWREQGLWAIAVYRYGRRVDAMRPSLWKRLHTHFYWAAFRFIETLVGVSIPKSVAIGPGLRILHFGNIFIHNNATIGARCTLRQGVTIGNRNDANDVPIVGDDVEFGAYAQALGAIRIGNGCKIGAMSLVLTDVPDGCTAVGVPARIIPPVAAKGESSSRTPTSVAGTYRSPAHAAEVD